MMEGHLRYLIIIFRVIFCVVLIDSYKLHGNSFLRSYFKYHTRSRARFSQENDNRFLIEPNDPSRTQQREPIESPFSRLLKHNWKLGLCKHVVTFESTEVIRRFKFLNEILAFGLIDGRVCMINSNTGKIISKMNDHSCEIHAIDISSQKLVTGSADGIINVYSINEATSITTDNGQIESRNNSQISVSKTVPFDFHTRAISGLKLVNIRNHTVMVSCSMDRKLVAVNLTTGGIIYQRELQLTPLCMDIHDGYIAVGQRNGLVNFMSLKSGETILKFQASADHIRSIHFLSSTVLLTGSHKGIVQRYSNHHETFMTFISLIT